MSANQSQQYDKRFPVGVIRKALKLLDEMAGQKSHAKYSLETTVKGRQRSYSDIEEFFNNLTGAGDAKLSCTVNTARGKTCALAYSVHGAVTFVIAFCEQESQCTALLNVFDENFGETYSFYPKPPRPFRIFIGHGNTNDWKDLRDHLQDIHKYKCLYFEGDPRAGFGVTYSVGSMLEEASFAVLVLTAEDMCNGKMRGRQNVIHEAGLFQAKLGFNRAIVLKEEGVEAFSNIAGVTYIPFQKDSISASYGLVIGTINREFPNLERDEISGYFTR